MGLLFGLLLAAGCYNLRVSNGGSEGVKVSSDRKINPAAIAVPDGYSVSVAGRGLESPTGICFDDDGLVCVTESGLRNGLPRLVRLSADGAINVIAAGDAAHGPFMGVAFWQGNFFVAQGGSAAAEGRILRISSTSEVAIVCNGLPTLGASPISGPVIGANGSIYFGIGSATNSGVVGADDSNWLAKHPTFHDLPAHDITLKGLNFQTSGVLAARGRTAQVTGAFGPYGVPSVPGQVVPGQAPATGSVYRMDASGGPLQLMAWGLRCPAGLALLPTGNLLISEQSYQALGDRPVTGSGDCIWDIDRPGGWCGFPDFHAGESLEATGNRYVTPGAPAPQALLAKQPDPVLSPAAVLPFHAGAAGLDVAPGPFGYLGQAFVAEHGDTAPVGGSVLAPVGFDVVRVDLRTGISHVFAANKSNETGPASKVGGGGLERPIAVKFDARGTNLYVVDAGPLFGDGSKSLGGAAGVIWKISRTN